MFYDYKIVETNTLCPNEYESSIQHQMIYGKGSTKRGFDIQSSRSKETG